MRVPNTLLAGSLAKRQQQLVAFQPDHVWKCSIRRRIKAHVGLLNMGRRLDRNCAVYGISVGQGVRTPPPGQTPYSGSQYRLFHKLTASGGW